MAVVSTSADEQRNQERRQSGLEDLQNLAELAQELSQLLFWRDLRELAGS